MTRQITKIESGTKYRDDVEEIETELEDIYRRFMLEEEVPDAAVITRCLVDKLYTTERRGFPYMS